MSADKMFSSTHLKSSTHLSLLCWQRLYSLLHGMKGIRVLPHECTIIWCTEGSIASTSDGRISGRFLIEVWCSCTLIHLKYKERQRYLNCILNACKELKYFFYIPVSEQRNIFFSLVLSEDASRFFIFISKICLTPLLGH